MNQNDLYIEYARVIQMCKGTALENTPWVCVKIYDGFHSHPQFNRSPELYKFAIAILEDKPVFVGDTLYWKTTGEEYIVNSYNKCTSMPLGYMTWQPPKPKRRIVLEETGKTGQPEVGEYVFNNGNLCLCRKPERWGNEHEIWRIVEDTGDKP